MKFILCKNPVMYQSRWFNLASGKNCKIYVCRSSNISKLENIQCSHILRPTTITGIDQILAGALAFYPYAAEDGLNVIIGDIDDRDIVCFVNMNAVKQEWAPLLLDRTLLKIRNAELRSS